MKSKLNVYEIITNQILEKLESGVVPWRKPWSNNQEQPKNLITDKNYSGLNLLLLGCANFDSSYWLTAKQVKSLKGYIKKGEKSTPVIFWKQSKKTNKNGEEENVMILRYYRLFNIEQCGDIESSRVIEEKKRLSEKNLLDFSPIKNAENILEGFSSSPIVVHGGRSACYSPALDRISMPNKQNFLSDEAYYATIFHELGHATGHKKRLNRDTLTKEASFGDEVYSMEELVAEFCSSFLCAHSGIDSSTLDNSVAYIKGWSDFLKNNSRAVIQASSKGKKACQFILSNGQVS